MADNSKYVQDQPHSLAGSGVIASATTMTLKSFTTIEGVPLTMTNFGTLGFGTCEPNNGTQEEQISFTGVVQNSNGTATLTGVSNVLNVAPYTQTSGFSKTHAGSTIFVITNTAGFYDRFTAKDNDETITGQWTFSTFPITPANSDASTTVKGVTKLSVAPVLSTNPIAVGDNDNRVPPVNTSTVTSGEVDALAGTFGTPSSSNKYVTDTDPRLTTIPIVRTYLVGGSPATWTKPAGLKWITVEVQAGGGGSGGTTTAGVATAGGGGGGYSRKLIAVGTLGATETVTTGAGGTAGADTGGNGGIGGSSSFGAHATATGGGGGTDVTYNGGAGGVGSSGDINIFGGGGGGGSPAGPGISSGAGGASHLGGGAPGQETGNLGGTGINGGVYGGGAGGAYSTGTDRFGGVGGAGIVIVTEFYQ